MGQRESNPLGAGHGVGEAAQLGGFGPSARSIAASFAALVAGAGEVAAQPPGDPAPVVARAVTPRAATEAQLDRRITISTGPLRLEELIGGVANLAGIKIETLWEGRTYPNGLSKEIEIELAVKNGTVREALEKIAATLERSGISATWQVLEDGRLQFGAKESLNRFQERRIIDLRDLTTAAPQFDGAPSFNLNGALQQGRGGGGGGSIIGEPRENSAPRTTTQEGLERLKEIIVSTVEPEQWSDAGGSGGTIRIYNGAMFIQAAPYILREL